MDKDLDMILHQWSEKFMLEIEWPEDVALEEKLDSYFLPQVHEAFKELEKEREYYQTRFYLMRWAFRKILKMYGQVIKDLEQENIRFLPQDLIDALNKEREA